jgi:alpha-L-arabinofuranosidase
MLADIYTPQYHPLKITAPAMPPFQWPSVPYSTEMACLQGLAFFDQDSTRLLVVNFHPWLSVTTGIDLGASAASSVSGSILSAESLYANNDYIDELQVVAKELLSEEMAGATRQFTFPPASVTSLRYQRPLP